MPSELTLPLSASEDVRLPKLRGRLKGVLRRPVPSPKRLSRRNRGECVDSMLICRAFGVFAPKVNRGVLKMGVPQSKQGTCPHPRRDSSTAVVRSGYADHSPPPFAPRGSVTG